METWLIEQAANALDSLVSILLPLKLFGSRFQGKKTWFAFGGGVVLYWGTILFVNAMSHYKGAWGFLYSAAILAYSGLALKGGFFPKLAQSLLWNLVLLVTGFLVMLLFYAAGVDMADYSYVGAKTRIASLAATGLLRYGAAWLFWFSWKRQKNFQQWSGREQAELTGTLAVLLGLSAAFFFAACRIVAGARRLELLAVMYGGMALLFGMVLFYFYERQKRRAQARKAAMERAEFEGRREDRRLLLELYSQAVDGTRELEEQMEALTGLLRKGALEEAKIRLEELDGQLKSLERVSLSTQNSSVNGAIARTVHLAREEEIGFSFVITGDVGRFPDADLGVLLCSLLDNAREGAMKRSGSREIRLEITDFRGYLKIWLWNTADADRLRQNPEFQTDKADPALHGFGMRRIRELVERYDGVMDMELDCREDRQGLCQRILLRKPSG